MGHERASRQHNMGRGLRNSGKGRDACRCPFEITSLIHAGTTDEFFHNVEQHGYLVYTKMQLDGGAGV